jgi:hypothetical protein
MNAPPALLSVPEDSHRLFDHAIDAAERKKKHTQTKTGGGLPHPPPLRPRVLTPRDRFVHRGGERGAIMLQPVQTFNYLIDLRIHSLAVMNAGY